MYVYVKNDIETLSWKIYLTKKKRQRDLHRDMKHCQKGLILLFDLMLVEGERRNLK